MSFQSLRWAQARQSWRPTCIRHFASGRPEASGRVREVRVGKGQWETLDSILSALQRIKAEETQRMLDKIAAAMTPTG